MSVPPSTDDDARVLRALRRPRSEVQITATIAAICQDRRAASRFVRVVLGSSPRPPGWLDRLPEELTCSSEREVPDGRVDLRFSDDAQELTVLMELKVDAVFGREQLSRYLGALPADSDRGALVAITKTTPLTGEQKADMDKRWVGSVRWGRILPSLRELAPQPSQVDTQWRMFLDILEEEGAMGYTTPDPELLDAWAKARPAEKHIVRLLDSLYEAARTIALRLGGLDEDAVPTPDPFVRSAGRRFHLTDGDARYGLTVPPRSNEERVRVGMSGGKRSLSAMIGVRAAVEGDDPAWTLRSRLRKEGYEERAGSRFLFKYRELTDTEKASPGLSETIATWLRQEGDRLLYLDLDKLWADAAPAAATGQPETGSVTRRLTDGESAAGQCHRVLLAGRTLVAQATGRTSLSARAWRLIRIVSSTGAPIVQ
jgi:hypothetical protein